MPESPEAAPLGSDGALLEGLRGPASVVHQRRGWHLEFPAFHETHVHVHKHAVGEARGCGEPVDGGGHPSTRPSKPQARPVIPR
jgi:hypothetical protein